MRAPFGSLCFAAAVVWGGCSFGETWQPDPYRCHTDGDCDQAQGFVCDVRAGLCRTPPTATHPASDAGGQVHDASDIDAHADAAHSDVDGGAHPDARVLRDDGGLRPDAHPLDAGGFTDGANLDAGIPETRVSVTLECEEDTPCTFSLNPLLSAYGAASADAAAPVAVVEVIAAPRFGEIDTRQAPDLIYTPLPKIAGPDDLVLRLVVPDAETVWVDLTLQVIRRRTCATLRATGGRNQQGTYGSGIYTLYPEGIWGRSFVRLTMWRMRSISQCRTISPMMTVIAMM